MKNQPAGLLRKLAGAIALFCLATSTASAAPGFPAPTAYESQIVTQVAFTRFQYVTASASALVCTFTTGNCAGTGGGSALFTAGTCDGVADDTPALDSFNSFVVTTWQATHTGRVDLVFPSGGVCQPLTDSITTPNGTMIVSQNIKNLRILGNGATLKNVVSIAFGSLDAIACGSGIAEASGCTGRIATVSAGATTLTVTACGGCTVSVRFPIGRYIAVTGIDLAGFGQPPTPGYFEYRKITNVVGSVITIDAPLTNSYKSTWPVYFEGGPFALDQGGAATIYTMSASWDQDFEAVDLVYDPRSRGANSATNTNARSFVYRGGAVLADAVATRCLNPSSALTWSVINTDLTGCHTEADKMVGTMTFDGVTTENIEFQSSAIGRFFLTNSTVTAYVHGTPAYTKVTNSTVAELWVGAEIYGRTDEFVCENSAITAFSQIAFVFKGTANVGVNLDANISIAGGVISVSGAALPPVWAVPGNNIFLQGAKTTQTIFQIGDITQTGGVAGTVHIATTLASGWPAVDLNAGKLFLLVHPAPKFTTTGCTGQIAFAEGAPAQAPLYSWVKATYNGTQIGTQSAATFGEQIWGVPTSLRWNVTAAYSGALTLHALGAFDNYPTADTVTYAGGTYGPTINLNQTGDRVTTATTVTCNGSAGACSGDSLSAPGATTWFTQGYFIAGSADISGSCSTSPSAGCPTVTMTLQTDQGVVYP